MESVKARIKVPLTRSEYNYLFQLALQQKRGVDQQLAWLLHEEMRRRGVVLPGDGQQQQCEQERRGDV